MCRGRNDGRWICGVWSHRAQQLPHLLSYEVMCRRCVAVSGGHFEQSCAGALQAKPQCKCRPTRSMPKPSWIVRNGR